MNGNHNLPNNADEGRITNNISNRIDNGSTTECHLVAAAGETEAERIEDCNDQLRPRSAAGPRFQPHHHHLFYEREEAFFYRWRDDRVAVADELYRLLVLGNNNHAEQQRDSSTCQDANNNNNAKRVRRGMSPEEMETRLDFFEFCYSLKCNHPNIHKVEIEAKHGRHEEEDDIFPDGRLRYLGNALLHNTCITELVVDVVVMFRERNDIQRASGLLEYIRTSTSLRKVGIRKKVYTRMDCMGANHLASLILDAITVNGSIQELDISEVYPIVAFHTLMSTTTSLKVLHIDCDCFHAIQDDDHRNRLLEALAMNRSIDYLSFTVRDNGWVWVERIPHCMKGGPAIVRKLKLDFYSDLPPPVYSLIASTSLRTLEIRCSGGVVSLQHASILQNALSRNTCIENFKLISEMTGGFDSMILLELHNGPSTLRKLCLKSSSHNGFHGLQQYLCRTTAMIQQLEFDGCIVYESCMNCLMHALDTRDSMQSTALIQVEFNSCQFAEPAMHKLAEYITRRSNRHNGKSLLLPGLALVSKETNFAATMHFPPEVNHRIFRLVNGMLVSMSTKLVSLPSSGISSDTAVSTHCISLSIYPQGNAPAYCDALMASVETSSVMCLQLSHIRRPDSLKLALWLPRLMSLSALHLINIERNVLPATILNGLQRNGSLLMTSFLTRGQQRFFQDEHDRIVVQSYCQRNRFLSEMILCKMAFRNVCSVDPETAFDDNANFKCLEDSGGTQNNHPVLLPTLFRVANVILLFRAHFLLAALLEFDATIGPLGGQLSV